MDLMSIHVSFLLFESIFCFLSALVSVSDKGFKNKRVMVTLLNISVGLLLLAEFTYYLFKDQDQFSSYIMVNLCSFANFFIVDFLIIAYVVFASYIIFGKFSLKKGAPCRIRLTLCTLIGLIGIIMVIVSQFTGIYYHIDEHNVYHRGPLFLISVAIPFLAMFIFVTIIIQNARKLGVRMTIALMSYFLLPLVGGILQYFFYGYSFLEMATGFSVILLFIEGAIDTKREVIRVSKTEVRTGLANEHGCVEWLNSKEDRSELLNYAVIFFDLIKFSEINRKHGMDMGDQFLHNYAASFSSFMDDDEILGRAYGNLFIAIVKKKKLKNFTRLLEKMDVTV
ncbi:MAG: diguanylate cyclase, partial [Clostridiales bacterium]|nr:diguanylate cyclase [Clostridiales bacterium]